MRISLELYSEKKLLLPVHYNYIIQGFIYKNITDSLRKFLHNKGFMFEKRSFKMFTFSRLQGKYELLYDKLSFLPPVYLTISSPYDKFLNELANSMLKKNNLSINGSEIIIKSIKVHMSNKFKNKMEIVTLTPIVVYSTLIKKNGSKKTYYYSPYEDEFSELISKNLEKKFSAFYGEKLTGGNLNLEVIRKPKEKIVKYKGTIIKGWMGEFKIKGNKKIIKLGYDCGIGCKNSQGFGMIEVAR